MFIVVRGGRDVAGRERSGVSDTASGLCLNDAFMGMCVATMISSFSFSGKGRDRGN